MRRRAIALLTSLALIVGFISGFAERADALGGELIIIDSVTVGSPVMTTTSDCEGYVEHGTPVLPLTIVATFIPPPNDEPIGPYAVGFWTGGLGSSDLHAGTDQAHNTTQVFHMLLRTDQLGSYSGAGRYYVSVIVQDVGLAGGFTEQANIPIDIGSPPPSSSNAHVKCALSKQFDTSNLLSDMADAARGAIIDGACGACGSLLNAWSTINTYNDILNHYTDGITEHDPPDENYQQIVEPEPPPVLPAPSGLSPSQQSAVLQAEQGLAKSIGLTRAVYRTLDRIWGADNANSKYWYRRQVAALADLSHRAANALRATTGNYNDLQAALAPIMPSFTVNPDNIYDNLIGLSHGFSATQSDLFTQLGESVSAQKQIARTKLSIDTRTLPHGQDGPTALYGQNFSGMAGALDLLAAWAAGTADLEPPVVASVSPDHVPVWGGTEVTITGTSLAEVSGINFGDSTPDHGQGTNIFCNDNQCTATAPPGTGTVHVTAVGPGGPSAPSVNDRLTYVAPPVPQVTHVYPNTGELAGLDYVTIFGTHLLGGTVYFGATEAAYWSCSDTRCHVQTPPSANPLAVDVSVTTTSGTSAFTAADQFTYLATPPGGPGAPVITSVSPSHGSDLGGDHITITGSNFTGASAVEIGGDFGNRVDDYDVIDDAHIELTTPRGDPGPAGVTVYGPGGHTTSPAAFTYDNKAKPHITAITPSSGPDIGGTEVTVTGTNLGGDSAFIEFGGAFAPDAVCTSTTCNVTAPPAPDGTVHVRISNDDGTSATGSADQFTYTAGPKPVITQLTPDSGTINGGTDVAIIGTNLNSGEVTFGGAAADGECGPSSCVVTSPTGKVGAATVKVKTFAGTSAPGPAATFTYARLAGPVVKSIEPNWGWLAGFTEVEVRGDDLTNGRVFFGGHEASNVVCTQTKCTARSPDASTIGPVHVTVKTPFGTSATSAADMFTYVQPTITKVSPSTGFTAGGTMVTITGTNLLDGTVTFGTRGVTQTCQTDTKCIVPAPLQSAPGTVDVQIQSPFITRSPLTAADKFTYTVRPAPTVTSVSPNNGTTLGGDQVTITGTNLSDGTVFFGTFGTSSPKCTSDTTCTVLSRSQAAGIVDVTVRTTAGNSVTNATDKFTYHASGPATITGVAPNHGSSAGGTAVTITGTDLTNGVVRFGTTLATNVSCGSTSCTATAPAGAPGAIDVRVQVGSQSAITPADHFTYTVPPVPAITRVSPNTGPASGGTAVTLTGTSLRGSVVQFGANPGTGVTCDDTSCTVLAPAGPAGNVDVRVTTPGGTSPVASAARFTYSRFTISKSAVPGVTTAMGGGAITRGIGDDLWFTLPNNDKVGRIAANGAITTIDMADGTTPLGIALGPDGRMWVTAIDTGQIVAIAANGTQTTYDSPGMAGDLRFITAGPDGRMWFSLANSGSIGAITTSGHITIYHLPDPYVVPYSLITGADGRLWFTEVRGNSVGAITTAGVVTEYTLPDVGASSWGISRGPDDRVWFAEGSNGTIAAVSTAGVVTNYPLPAPSYNPQGITYGPDGRMWFADPNRDQVGALDPTTGAVATYALPGGQLGEEPRYLGLAKDGSLWLPDFGAANVLKIAGIATATPPTVTAVSPDHGPAAGGTTVTIIGTNLGTASAVKFGTTAAAFTVVDPGHVAATVPAGSAGPVHVRVTTPSGTSDSTDADRFGYTTPPSHRPTVTDVSPPTGLTTGGTVVTITGTDLTGATIKFGPAAASTVSCTATSCTATAPAGSVGTLDVTATTGAGTSEANPADEFTYLEADPAAPTITSVSPSAGAPAGGTAVTVTGTHLAGALITFGLDRATGSCSATSCTVTSPRGSAGVVDVRAETAGGRTAPAATDTFTYTAAPIDASALTITGPAHAKYGSTVKLATKATDTTTHGGLGGAVASLYRRANPNAAWAKVGSATTDPSGAAQLTTTARSSAQYQWRYLGATGHQGATSPTKAVSVAQLVTIAASKTSIKHGKTVQLYGTVGPSTSGHKVTLQRKSGSKWVSAGSARLHKQKLPNGKRTVGYLFTVRLKSKGSFTYRVYSPAISTCTPGTSPSRTLRAT